MKGVIIVPFLLCLISQIQTRDDDFRVDIETAAKDSALLAEELAQMLARLENGDNVAVEEEDSFLDSELEEALKLSNILGKGQRRRNPKQESEGFDFGFVGKLLDVLKVDDKKSKVEDQVFDENFENSGKRKPVKEEERSGKGPRKSQSPKPKSENKYPDNKEADETCEETEATNDVNICVPKYEARPHNLYFKGQETYDEEYCYTKTLTTCSTDSSPLSREVCTFKYSQKEHNVPATNIEIAFEKFSEKMGVTNCKHVKDDYGKMTEVCGIEDISFHYKLPVVLEEVLEFVTVEYPEPEEECSEVELELPSVECDHKEEQYCVDCSHIRDSKEPVTADKVSLTRYGECEDRSLSLDQAMCTVTQHIKTSAPPPQHRPHSSHYSQPRSSAFTAFQ